MIKNFSNPIKLFLLFIVVYGVSSIFIHMIQLYLMGVPNTFSDESAYFALTYGYLENKDVPDFVNTRLLTIFPYELHKLYFQILAIFGYILDAFGINTFFLSKLISIIFGALSVVYIFNLQKKFFNDDVSVYYKGAIFFGFLPFMILYSSVLLRDILILFFTIYSVFHIMKFSDGDKVSFIKVLVSLLIMYHLRSENGIFLFFLIFCLFFVLKREKVYNLINQMKRIKYKFTIIIILTALTVLVTYSLFIYVYGEYLSEQNAYIGRLLTNPPPSGSLLMKVSAYPVYVSSSVKILVSQIIPFPFWKHLDTQPARIVESLNGIIWLFICLSAFVTIVNKKLRKHISPELIFLYLTALLYIILISNIQVSLRRLIVMYPFIYIVAYIGLINMTKTYRKILFFVTILLLLVIYAIYIYIKY